VLKNLIEAILVVKARTYKVMAKAKDLASKAKVKDFVCTKKYHISICDLITIISTNK